MPCAPPAQYICWPPLIDSVDPVTNPASSAHRKATPRAISCALPSRPTGIRSEEHTSELQSLMRISYAVFCLKKKTTKIKQEHENTLEKQKQYNNVQHLDAIPQHSKDVHQ